MANRTPEYWAALQRDTDRWAAQRSDEELARFARALQLNWKQTKSRDAWEALQCIYTVQHQRSSGR
jgi:plasmid maintenance system antidote protein VapI